MAKYEPLRRYLARQKTARVELTFSDIERLIGAFPPKAAALPDVVGRDRGQRPARAGPGLARGGLSRPA